MLWRRVLLYSYHLVVLYLGSWQLARHFARCVECCLAVVKICFICCVMFGSLTLFRLQPEGSLLADAMIGMFSAKQLLCACHHPCKTRRSTPT
jgi:hypothetical protein